MAFRQFSPTGYLGPADRFHEYGTGPSPEYTVEDYEKQQTTNPNTLPRTLPGSGTELRDLLKGNPKATTYEFMDEFRDSPFYKDAGNYSGLSTMDMKYNPFTGSYGGSSDFNRYKHAYDKFLTERSKPTDFNENQPAPEQQPFQFDQPKSPSEDDLRRSQIMRNLMGGFGRSPFMGGFGRSPFMGGYGSPFGGFGRSPFGGLGMFGMSPYGGYGGYGMFGGMMNPFMGMGGFGQMQPYRSNFPFARGMRFPQQPQQLAADRSTLVTDPTNFTGGTQPGVSTPSTQQPFQSPNPFMNPFMAGLGSMMGNMFGGGYGSNVPNTQANVAQ